MLRPNPFQWGFSKPSRFWQVPVQNIKIFSRRYDKLTGKIPDPAGAITITSGHLPATRGSIPILSVIRGTVWSMSPQGSDRSAVKSDTYAMKSDNPEEHQGKVCGCVSVADQLDRYPSKQLERYDVQAHRISDDREGSRHGRENQADAATSPTVPRLLRLCRPQ